MTINHQAPMAAAAIVALLIGGWNLADSFSSAAVSKTGRTTAILSAGKENMIARPRVAPPFPTRQMASETEMRWGQMCAERPGNARRKRMLALLQELAARDPVKAWAWGAAVGEEPLRCELLQAVMRRWASIDFRAAASRARRQDDLPRDVVLAALFDGGSNRPEVLLAYARRIVREEPELTKATDSVLVRALGSAGMFEQAAAIGAADETGKLLASAYKRWGFNDPEGAVLSAIAVPDRQNRGHAFRAAVAGWAQADPRSLLESALSFPEGPEKTFATIVGLRHLNEQDAEASARWAKTHLH